MAHVENPSKKIKQFIKDEKKQTNTDTKHSYKKTRLRTILMYYPHLEAA